MKTEQILTFLRVVAWVLFIGAIIRTVALTVVIASRADWSGISLYSVESQAPFFVFGLWLAVAVLHVRLWEKVKDVLTKMNLENPFTMETAHRLLGTSYALLAIWVVSFIGKSCQNYVERHLTDVENVLNGFNYDLIAFNAEVVYLLNAGIVYIIAQIFIRGVELQQENELTI